MTLFDYSIIHRTLGTSLIWVSFQVSDFFVQVKVRTGSRFLSRAKNLQPVKNKKKWRRFEE
jgi:hypothetical protein